MERKVGGVRVSYGRMNWKKKGKKKIVVEVIEYVFKEKYLEMFDFVVYMDIGMIISYFFDWVFLVDWFYFWLLMLLLGVVLLNIK